MFSLPNSYFSFYCDFKVDFFFATNTNNICKKVFLSKLYGLDSTGYYLHIYIINSRIRVEKLSF